MRAIYLALMFLLLLHPALQAEGFNLGGVQVSVGMPKKDVMEAFGALSEELLLHDIGDGDWLVLDKKQGGKVGNFQIRQGKVVQVSRQWLASNVDDANRLANSIFSVIANSAGNDGTMARISTREIRAPERNGKEILILFPHRRIWIRLTDGYGVTVEEGIE